MTYTDQELQDRIAARAGSTRRWELLLTAPQFARAAIVQEAHFVMNHVGGRFSDAVQDAIRAWERGDAFTSPLAQSLYVDAAAARLRGQVHACKFCGIQAPKSRYDAVTFWPAAKGFAHSTCWDADVDRRRKAEVRRTARSLWPVSAAQADQVLQGGYDSLKGGASDGLANYCPDGI